LTEAFRSFPTITGLAMGFKELITKVQQAEETLEAKERHAAAQWDVFKAQWRGAWTPGRIVIAGLASGFVVGRAQPVKAAAKSGQMMQMITMLSGLFAGGSAKVAADEAGHAAKSAKNVAEAVAPEAAVAHPDARDGVIAGTPADAAAADASSTVPPPGPDRNGTLSCPLTKTPTPNSLPRAAPRTSRARPASPGATATKA
jgi:hypothetical protein